MKIRPLCSIFLLVPLYIFGQTRLSQNEWVDSVFRALTPSQRLGQLFMVAAYSNKDETHYKKIDTLVEKYGIGGLIFFQGGPKRQIQLTNRYQSKATVKLLIGFDGEWGLAMRLDSTLNFPRQMTLGAVQNHALIYDMGRQIATHCKRLGIHVNFAPVADINVNPDNPVIGTRAFGEIKEQVADRAVAYMKGLQHQGVMACAKHFPGHGDTDADSHYALPIINHSKKRLENIELFPFRKLIKDSIESVMVAHMHIPAYDNRPNIASTLAPAVVTQLLQEQMGFNGLVFTDALNMKGVSQFYKPGEVDLMALKAGNDVLLFAENVPVALTKIQQALDSGLLDRSMVEKKVKKILSYKYKYQLFRFNPLDTHQVYQELNHNSAKALRQKLYEAAATLLKNENKIIPIGDLATHTFAALSIGNSVPGVWHEMLRNYAPVDLFHVSKTDTTQFGAWADSLSRYSRVLISIHDLTNRRKERYGISPKIWPFIQKLQTKTSVIVVYFGNVYGIKEFQEAKHLLCMYEDNEATQSVAAQIIFGALGTNGKLPVTVSPQLPAGLGVQSKNLERLRYGYPESVSIASDKFYKLDSIVQEALMDGSTPGAQLQIVKNGTVIYRKNFGYLSYDRTEKVTNETVYDLASVTKTAATMQAIMFLFGWKAFNPDLFLKTYLPELENTNKNQIILKDLLVHQAGLVPYLEVWKKTMKDGKPDAYYYSTTRSAKYSKTVAQSLYTATFLEDSVWQWVVQSKLLNDKSDTGCYPYKYSDLAFFFLKKIAENQLNQPLENFLYQNFYKPLGCFHTRFNPLNYIPERNVAPTEEDKSFRMKKIQGTVHDQNAAMLGGVSGHAGLFSNANDLSILGQMHLRNGMYARTRYLTAKSIQEFTQPPYVNNRRALGWDRPFVPDEVSKASSKTYGHTGFTGTAWWMDPENDLVITFLCNRTYPFADNKKLTTQNVRTKILNCVYECIGK